MPDQQTPLRVVLDQAQDEATIFFSDERQSEERGATYLVVAHEERAAGTGVTVNVAFEDYQRLLWIKVTRASAALPEALLARAERQ